jgi:hypothetical protein
MYSLIRSYPARIDPCQERLTIINQLSVQANGAAVLAGRLAVLGATNGVTADADRVEIAFIKREFAEHREEWRFMQQSLLRHRAEHGC